MFCELGTICGICERLLQANKPMLPAMDKFYIVHVLLAQQLWQPLDHAHTGQCSQQASTHQVEI